MATRQEFRDESNAHVAGFRCYQNVFAAGPAEKSLQKIKYPNFESPRGIW